MYTEPEQPFSFPIPQHPMRPATAVGRDGEPEACRPFASLPGLSPALTLEAGDHLSQSFFAATNQTVIAAVRKAEDS